MAYGRYVAEIACGSFYDWLGEPVLVVADLGIDFDVRPDDRAEQVAGALRNHEFVQKLLDRGACKFDLPLDMESPLVMEPTEKGFGVDLARILAVRVRSGVQENWRELRAIEDQLEAITDDFDGEDHPTALSVLSAESRRRRIETQRASYSRWPETAYRGCPRSVGPRCRPD